MAVGPVLDEAERPGADNLDLAGRLGRLLGGDDGAGSARARDPGDEAWRGFLELTTTVFASGVSMAATGRMIAAEAPTRP